MGNFFSYFSILKTAGSSPPSKPGLGYLPENCISSIYTFLDPPEICKFAILSRSFHNASLADFVWESKLPSNYKFLVDKLVQGNEPKPPHLSKKDIYAKLCRRNRSRPSSDTIFDGGTKEVWLDKRSGKVFMSISSKGLKVTGIDDGRYWNFIPTDESRFETVAYLQQIWWVEILGELEFEFASGSYSLYFRVKLGKTSRRFGRKICNLDQVHGWELKPVRFHLSTSNGQRALLQCYLHEAATGNWIHYHVGDFVVDKSSNKPLKLKFSMVQIDCTHTKGGLCLDSVLIYPCDLKERC